MEISLATIITLPEEINPLISVGLLLILSYAGGHIAGLLKAPKVMGYLVTGMILSPSILGVFPKEIISEDLGIITQMALSIIAFSIGGSLKMSMLRRLGRQILWITASQALGAMILATAAISIFFIFFSCSGVFLTCFWRAYFPFALVIGAICAATAPAATLAIVHEYKAKGPLTIFFWGSWRWMMV